MIPVAQINRLHEETVDRWHQAPIDNPYEEPLSLVCTQHSFNYQLWHEEDIARRTDVDDAEIARVKRSIDRLNQQRNDWIERIDDWIAERAEQRGISAQPNAPRNTETPGSAIDRLSILALRMYHLREQLDREDASPDHREKVRQRLSICRAQQQDLSESLQLLLDDIEAGRKRHGTYRQFKMYNDPTMNPYLYRQRPQQQTG